MFDIKTKLMQLLHGSDTEGGDGSTRSDREIDAIRCLAARTAETGVVNEVTTGTEKYIELERLRQMVPSHRWDDEEQALALRTLNSVAIQIGADLRAAGFHQNSVSADKGTGWIQFTRGPAVLTFTIGFGGPITAADPVTLQPKDKQRQVKIEWVWKPGEQQEVLLQQEFNSLRSAVQAVLDQARVSNAAGEAPGQGELPFGRANESVDPKHVLRRLMEAPTVSPEQQFVALVPFDKAALHLDGDTYFYRYKGTEYLFDHDVHTDPSRWTGSLYADLYVFNGQPYVDVREADEEYVQDTLAQIRSGEIKNENAEIAYPGMTVIAYLARHADYSRVERAYRGASQAVASLAPGTEFQFVTQPEKWGLSSLDGEPTIIAVADDKADAVVRDLRRVPGLYVVATMRSGVGTGKWAGSKNGAALGEGYQGTNDPEPKFKYGDAVEWDIGTFGTSSHSVMSGSIVSIGGYEGEKYGGWKYKVREKWPGGKTESKYHNEVNLRPASAATSEAAPPPMDPVDGATDTGADPTAGFGSNENREPDQETDIIISDIGRGKSAYIAGYAGKSFGQWDEWDETIAGIKAWMKKENFYPDVAFVNERGNVSWVNLDTGGYYESATLARGRSINEEVTDEDAVSWFMVSDVESELQEYPYPERGTAAVTRNNPPVATPDAIAVWKQFKLAVKTALNAWVQQGHKFADGFDVDVMMREDAPVDVLLTLNGEGAGIWDGRWDRFFADTKDLKPLERFLKSELEEWANVGAGKMNAALADAARSYIQSRGVVLREATFAQRVVRRLRLNEAVVGDVLNSHLGRGVTDADPRLKHWISTFAPVVSEKLQERGFTVLDSLISRDLVSAGLGVFVRSSVASLRRSDDQDDDAVRGLPLRVEQTELDLWYKLRGLSTPEGRVSGVRAWLSPKDWRNQTGLIPELHLYVTIGGTGGTAIRRAIRDRLDVQPPKYGRRATDSLQQPAASEGVRQSDEHWNVSVNADDQYSGIIDKVAVAHGGQAQRAYKIVRGQYNIDRPETVFHFKSEKDAEAFERDVRDQVDTAAVAMRQRWVGLEEGLRDNIRQESAMDATDVKTRFKQLVEGVPVQLTAIPPAGRQHKCPLKLRSINETRLSRKTAKDFLAGKLPLTTDPVMFMRNGLKATLKLGLTVFNPTTHEYSSLERDKLDAADETQLRAWLQEYATHGTVQELLPAARIGEVDTVRKWDSLLRAAKAAGPGVYAMMKAETGGNREDTLVDKAQEMDGGYTDGHKIWHPTDVLAAATKVGVSMPAWETWKLWPAEANAQIPVWARYGGDTVTVWSNGGLSIHSTAYKGNFLAEVGDCTGISQHINTTNLRDVLAQGAVTGVQAGTDGYRAYFHFTSARGDWLVVGERDAAADPVQVPATTAEQPSEPLPAAESKQYQTTGYSISEGTETTLYTRAFTEQAAVREWTRRSPTKCTVRLVEQPAPITEQAGVDSTVRRLMASGMSPKDALTEAIRKAAGGLPATPPKAALFITDKGQTNATHHDGLTYFIPSAEASRLGLEQRGGSLRAVIVIGGKEYEVESQYWDQESPYYFSIGAPAKPR